MGNYQQLKVWKRSMDVAAAVYRLTDSYPDEERYRLRAQMRSAAASVPSNLAEGEARTSPRDHARFLDHALGSLWELETQLILSQRVGFLGAEEVAPLLTETSEIGKMLASMTREVRKLAKRVRASSI